MSHPSQVESTLGDVDTVPLPRAGLAQREVRDAPPCVLLKRTTSFLPAASITIIPWGLTIADDLDRLVNHDAFPGTASPGVSRSDPRLGGLRRTPSASGSCRDGAHRRSGSAAQSRGTATRLCGGWAAASPSCSLSVWPSRTLQPSTLGGPARQRPAREAVGVAPVPARRRSAGHPATFSTSGEVNGSKRSPSSRRTGGWPITFAGDQLSRFVLVVEAGALDVVDGQNQVGTA